MKYLIFAFITLSICPVCHLEETGTSEILIADAVTNDTAENVTDVELLVPRLPVSDEEPFGSNHHSNTDVSAHFNAATSTVWSSSSALLSQCGLMPNTSRAATFLDFMMGLTDSFLITSSDEEGDSKLQTNHGVKKITCVPRNTSDSDNLPLVRILNSSELLQHLGSRNSTSGRCTIVLFYAPWCVFSARVAPHYNALARAFPALDVVAIDAFHFSSLNSRFGTIAVPNVMIFHSAKAIARFNGSERTLANLTSFISNVTGMQADLTVEVTEADYVGPLLSEPNQETDYLLLLSWMFVILCCIVGVFRSNAGLRVWNTLVAMGHHEQHHHQHID